MDTSTVTIRHPKAQEVERATLGTGYEHAQIDPSWVWVADEEGELRGAIVGANFHGVFVALRMTVKKEEASDWLAAMLLKAAVKDAVARGCTGYIVLLDPMNETEKRMGEYLMRFGDAMVYPRPHLVYYGPLPTRVS